MAEQTHQIKSRLIGGADILVATPGRLIYALGFRHSSGAHALSLENGRIAIYDAADGLLSLNLREQMEKIQSYLDLCSVPVQRWFFSSQYSEEQREKAYSLMDEDCLVNEVYLRLEQEKMRYARVEQTFRLVPEGQNQRLIKLIEFFHSIRPIRTIVLCATQDAVEQVCHGLNHADSPIQSVALHGSLPQETCESSVQASENGYAPVLVSTIGLSRGVNFKGIGQLIFYNIPDTLGEYTRCLGSFRGAHCLALYRSDDKSLMGPRQSDFLKFFQANNVIDHPIQFPPTGAETDTETDG